jgi:hypothetical protein
MVTKFIEDFQPESLAKAKELQVPGSLAAKAAVGIFLYLNGHREQKVINMIKDGINFCDWYQRDLKNVTESKLTDSPRFYKPKEVLGTSIISATAETSIADKLNTLKENLSLVGTPKADSLTSEKLIECQKLLTDLSMPYIAGAMESIGDYKRSRKSSTW